MPKRITRTIPELVNLLVDVQISLSANPPDNDRNDQRFRHRAALLNELVFAAGRDHELNELLKSEDVAELAQSQLNSLSLRVYELEQQLFNPKPRPKPKAKGKTQ